MLNELKIFVVTAEEGSLTAAAARLGMTVATVSRRISGLEEHLGCKLLHRSPRGLTLTQEGRAYFTECAEFVHSLDRRLESLNDTLNSLAGPLKVLAPTNFAVGALDEFWERFIGHYPQIELSIELNNGLIDIRQARADVALRIGPQPDSSLVQKALGHMETVLVASPGPSLPESIEELERVPTVATGVLDRWELSNDRGDNVTLKRKHRYLTNDLNMALNLVQYGGGVALLPLSAVHEALQSQTLVRVLPQWRGQDRHFYLVWPYRRALSVRAGAFVSALTEYLGAKPWFHSIESSAPRRTARR